MVSKIIPIVLRGGLLGLFFIVCTPLLPSPLIDSKWLEGELLSSLAMSDEVLAENLRAGNDEIVRRALPLPLSCQYGLSPALRVNAASMQSTFPVFHHSPVRRVHQLIAVYRI